jgi:hypothetical protein
MIWASRFAGASHPLASGYPLHHLHTFRVRTRGAHSPHVFGGSATIPLASASFARGYRRFVALVLYLVCWYQVLATY